ncbi:MAG TPA: molybdopterin molybdotransferase MoeA [Candidatus Obscuribacter sp.]|nr:molybdopterin molybdotransferase MoeA [Candidatus Obscuribacter sp.]HMY02083.1 molybdopterin molybdotransferase MoeA [Candidatus Obscuribacter sp.]HNB14038.1 molybdopterin molybdotransferase MoeA [Candidatus Obscuribacter sp.]HND05243.1 molybdopterin molybdotransferase MoeA [Candidatus Obscuribacter sp.]HND65415.1 molybdopterin molybdotransferase MoeA [Candidatus Obscuribacter sp.]
MNPYKANTEVAVLTYEEALQAILRESARIERQEELVDLEESAFRVLAKPLTAPFDLPRFNNSAVDGFGVLVEDLNGDAEAVLTLKSTIAAGDGNGHQTLKSGECIKILTGAPVPDWVEAVVMKEFCQEEEGTIKVKARVRIGENIRMTGEELEEGATVLEAGTLLSPPALGLAATAGAAQVTCFSQPRICIVSSGDELKEPGQALSASQIYNSNSYAVEAALKGLYWRSENIKRLHTADEPQAVKDTLKSALEDCRVLITLGGVSVGDRDFIKPVLEEMGVRTVFWKVAIKPGKPVYFAVTAAGQLIFGLPGNPVSALITFHLFVKPALKILMGDKTPPPPLTTLKARLTASLKKKAGRLDFVRARLQVDEEGNLSVTPTTGQDSHMLSGLASANALINFESHLEYLPEGATVTVMPLSWSW